MSGQTNVGLISMNRPGKPDLIHPEGQGTYLQILKMVKKMFIRWVMKIWFVGMKLDSNYIYKKKKLHMYFVNWNGAGPKKNWDLILENKLSFS